MDEHTELTNLEREYNRKVKEIWVRLEQKADKIAKIYCELRDMKYVSSKLERDTVTYYLKIIFENPFTDKPMEKLLWLKIELNYGWWNSSEEEINSWINNTVIFV